MKDILSILRQRRERRANHRRSAEQRASRLGLGCGFILSVLMFALIIAGALSYAELTRDLPSLEQLPVLLNPQDGQLLQPTRLYDRTGRILLTALEPPNVARAYLYVNPSASPAFSGDLVRVLVAQLDPDFWQHSGFTLAGWQEPEKHPTLTQKLVSDLLLWNEPPSSRRALRERILAAQITARYGREQVLEWFLNSAYFGRYAYGAQAAAQLYFGVSAEKLDLAQSILLIATLESPALNPIDAPQSAILRQLEIIQSLSLRGVITEEEAAQARATSIKISQPVAIENRAPAFTQLVFSQLEARFARVRLERGGLNIITSLDYALQIQSACALKNGLSRFAQTEDIFLAADGSECVAERFLPPLSGDSRPLRASASAVILDPQSGQILALVGEVNSGQETAQLTRRPAGTLLSPFIYLTGFTRGLSPSSLLWDVPSDENQIQNLDGKFHGPLQARTALVNDYLVSTSEVLAQQGADNVLRIMRLLGLESASVPSSVALVTGEMAFPAHTLAHAYAVFAAEGALYGQPVQGSAPQAYSVLRLETTSREVLLDWTPPISSQILSPQLAYLMTHSLQESPAGGVSPLLEIDRPAAAKLGQTLTQTESWAAGYTPQRVVLIWAGSEVPLSTRLPASLWSGLMRFASDSLPRSAWATPPGMTYLDVCDPSGLLPTEYCPKLRQALFLSGNEPKHPDNLYQPFDVNIETGFLATVFTPPSLLEKRVYLIVPPSAYAWASEAGLDTPPQMYDTIQQRVYLPEAHITSPAIFSDIYGNVLITGSAGGENFSYYRLQFGAGLYPEVWQQIGGDISQPVTEGLLAEWNTSNLSGLYALRLQVVSANQSIQSETIQVVIDNYAPQIEVLFPQDGAEYAFADYPEMNFQIQISDDIFLEQVQIYLDDVLLSSKTNPPFTQTWKGTLPGSHSLRLIALDRAGNQTERIIRFTLKR